MPNLPRLRRNVPRARTLPSRQTSNRLRPMLEVCEDRLLLSTFTVNSLGDTGTGSGSSGDLRYCVTQADLSAGNIINFSVTGTIPLASALPNLGQDMTITGPGAASVTVQGGGAATNFSVFTISAGTTVAISGLTIAGGHAANGGGIDNGGTLTLSNSTLSGDSATSFGGGIYNGGTLTLTNTTISGDSATSGGGIYSNYGAFTLTNTTISANRGGGISGRVKTPTFTLNNTIVAGNLNPAPSSQAVDINIGLTSINPSSFNNLIGTGGAGGLTDGTNGNLVGVASPGLGVLGQNGGPTQTIALLAGSPALQAGNDAKAVDSNGTPLTTDQRGVGFSRVQGAHVDIGAFEFTPLSQTISFGSLSNQTYGASLTLSSTATSGLPVAFKVLFGQATVLGNVLTVTGIGPVVVDASQAGNATYAAATPVDLSFTVTPAKLTITPTVGQTKVYGAALPALTEAPSGLVNGDTASVVTGALGTAATAASPVGNYAFTLGTLSAGANYTLAIVASPSTLAVTKATLTITPTVGQTKVYGATLPALTETPSGLVNGDTASVVTGTLGTAATASSAVGNYAFTLGTLNAGANYTLAIAASPATLAVTKAALTITPTADQTKVYGAALPALTETPSGFVNGDTASVVTGALGTAASAASPVGNYAFTLGTLSAGANYTLALAASPPTLSVTPAPLVISADSVTAISGQALPSLTVSYSGFVNGDSANSLTSLPVITTTATAASAPGVYAITIHGASSPNYTITQTPGTLTLSTISAVPTTIVSASIQTIHLTKKKTAKAIVLVWNASLNPADALNRANFQLTTVPAKKKQHSQSVAIGQILYQPGSTSLTIVTSKPLNVKTPMKLTINTSGLHDAAGNLVGSTSSSQPGPSIVFLVSKAGVHIQASLGR